MRNIRLRNLLFVFLTVALCRVSLFAQAAQLQPTELATYIKENYTKREVFGTRRQKSAKVYG